MLARLTVAVTALLAVTAFAPAPFPGRPPRLPNPLDPQNLRGDWTVVSLWRYGPNKSIAYHIDAWKAVRFDNGQWSFCIEADGVLVPKTTYDLRIDTGKRPVAIDFRQPGQHKVWMMGILRHDGPHLEVLYKPFATDRPTSFEEPPTDFYLFRLARRR